MNPGTGHVSRATKRAAIYNMKAFMRDMAVPGAFCDFVPRVNDGGRWDFIVALGAKTVEVAMPGCHRDVVRNNKSPWMPRLYVDGSSWYWPFALELTKDALGVRSGQ